MLSDAAPCYNCTVHTPVTASNEHMSSYGLVASFRCQPGTKVSLESPGCPNAASPSWRRRSGGEGLGELA
jgi:hypothetical protein